MKYRFFRYSGSKFNYTEDINSIIKKSKNKIYIEPFVGSGAVLFNLNKEFDEYIINDIDKNIITIYNTFKCITYEEYLNEKSFIKKEFGEFKNHKNAKENYYAFRNWFNENHWNTGSKYEGLYLYFLANMCINSFLRFGPNGMNQSFGNRFYTMNKDNFEHIHNVLQKTKIYNTDYKDIFTKYPDGLYFLDPPYFSQDSSYDGFSKKDFIEFLELIKGKEYIYTDILNEFNQEITNRKFIRAMRNTSPLTDKHITKNKEYIFSSLSLKEELEEW